jgi:hypothetical protein
MSEHLSHLQLLRIAPSPHGHDVAPAQITNAAVLAAARTERYNNQHPHFQQYVNDFADSPPARRWRSSDLPDLL